MAATDSEIRHTTLGIYDLKSLLELSDRLCRLVAGELDPDVVEVSFYVKNDTKNGKRKYKTEEFIQAISTGEVIKSPYEIDVSFFTFRGSIRAPGTQYVSLTLRKGFTHFYVSGRDPEDQERIRAVGFAIVREYMMSPSSVNSFMKLLSVFCLPFTGWIAYKYSMDPSVANSIGFMVCAFVTVVMFNMTVPHIYEIVSVNKIRLTAE